MCALRGPTVVVSGANRRNLTNGSMARKQQHKPLAHFPSAMAQDKTPVKMPRRRRVVSAVFKMTAGLLVGVVLLVGGLFLYLSRGPVSNERLRLEIENALSTMVGEQYSADISDANISFGKSGLLSIATDQLTLLKEKSGRQLVQVGKVHVGLKILPLLQGQMKVSNIMLDGARIDLRSIQDDRPTGMLSWPDALRLEKVMRFPAERLLAISNSMRESDLKDVVLHDLTITGLDLPGGKDKTILVHKVAFRRVGNEGDLRIVADATFENKHLRLGGSWTSGREGYVLDVSLDGLDFSHLLPSAARSREGAVGIDAPMKLTYSHPFDADLRPLQSIAHLEISSGLLRLGKDDIVPIASGDINLRLIPEKNQVELEKSYVQFGASSAVLTGGIRFPLYKRDGSDVENTHSGSGSVKNAADLPRPIFELIANDIVADPDDANGKPLGASFKVTGEINADAKTLTLSEINLWSDDGNLAGSGSVGFTGETPSLALALTLPKIRVSAVRQLWPFFIAPKARAWVLSHITGGVITNGRIDAAIPAGILGRIRKGKKLAPEHLTVSLNVTGANVETIGDLPAVSKASGEVLYQGMKTRIKLSKGTIQTNSGHVVDVSGGTMKIGDFQDKPTMASLDLDLSGRASDLLWISGRKPLRVPEQLQIRPSDASGKGKVKLTVAFPMEKKFVNEKLDWSADIKIINGALAKPLNGYQVSKANLTIKAKPGSARINGKVLLDGVPATISLVEPFGKENGQASRRSARLLLDGAARKKLGLNLDGILIGRVSVEFSDAREKGWKKIKADLTRSTLKFPWINWTKGKGIKASAQFLVRTRNGRTIVRNFNLSGAGFRISGNMMLDKSGLVSADLSRFTLNKTDKLGMKIVRKGRGYSISMRGKSYDARAVVSQILAKGTPQDRITKGKPIELTANIAKVTGFGRETLSNVTVKYAQNNGQLNSVVLKGLARGNARTEISIIPEKGVTTTTLLSTNAGAALRFLDVYKKMRGGELTAKLKQKGNGTHKGKVLIRNFHLIDEPKLKSLISSGGLKGVKEGRDQTEHSAGRKTDPKDLKVNVAAVDIVKSDDMLIIKSGIMRAGDIGSNFSGTVYDKNGNMHLKGTFLPGYGLNKFASKIPIVGLAFGNGTKSGFLGITFRLKGKAKNPTIAVNPLSLITPGVFRKIFEFR